MGRPFPYWNIRDFHRGYHGNHKFCCSSFPVTIVELEMERGVVNRSVVALINEATGLGLAAVVDAQKTSPSHPAALFDQAGQARRSDRGFGQTPFRR
jgi:hypothetical protein